MEMSQYNLENILEMKRIHLTKCHISEYEFNWSKYLKKSELNNKIKSLNQSRKKEIYFDLKKNIQSSLQLTDTLNSGHL